LIFFPCSIFVTDYANEIIGWKSGYYMSAVAVFIGTFCLFLTDVRRRKLSRRKSQNSSMKTYVLLLISA